MIQRQIALRPQDIVVLLKIVSLRKQGQPWLKKDLAGGLNLANSEITNVFGRLGNTGLLGASKNVVQPNALFEFLIYGLKATFPPYIGAETRGFLTGVNVFPESGIKGVNYVWASFEGTSRGAALSPLYPEVVSAAKNDKILYHALSACDMIRVGQTREISFAREWLKKFIFE